MLKVENMKSDRSGREVANQFIITTDEGRYFQSYDTVIAFKPYNKKMILDERAWNYSNTTAKYRRQFLGESITETRVKIQNGTYELGNLN